MLLGAGGWLLEELGSGLVWCGCPRREGVNAAGELRLSFLQWERTCVHATPGLVALAL